MQERSMSFCKGLSGESRSCNADRPDYAKKDQMAHFIAEYLCAGVNEQGPEAFKVTASDHFQV